MAMEAPSKSHQSSFAKVTSWSIPWLGRMAHLWALPATLMWALTMRLWDLRQPFIWWFESGNLLIEAIESRQFEYIVFTYPPTIECMEAIQANGYERIAPSAWHRLPGAAGTKENIP